MPHYQCHGGQKQVQELLGPTPPPPGLAFSFQRGDAGRPWTAAWTRSSLTSVRAGRSQSHIKLSEDPKVPVRSVNSSIVPLSPRTQRDRCNKAPPQWSTHTPHPLPPPPRWACGYGDTLQLLGVRRGGSYAARMRQLRRARAKMMGSSLRRLITLKVQPVPTGSKRF